MTWQLWIIVGWFVLAGLFAIGSVGKPRKTVEPSAAVFAVLISAALIALVIWGSHA